jgi:hypothetical protein
VWSGTDPEPLTAQLIDELRAGNIYVNIHTQANAAGEIRGQLEVPTLAAEFDDNQEMPPVQVGSLATGVGLFTLTPDGLRFNITIDTEKLTGPITNAHFHNAPPGAAGNVVRTIFDDLVGNVASGIWTATDPEPLTPELIDELLAGNIYVNVHTQANPPGEIRGQIVTPSLGAAVLPTSRSVQVGSSATAFASLVHAGSPAAVGCTIAPVTSVAADFLFQTTDPATNAPSGTADTAIDVPAAETQTFVMAFTPTAEFGATDVVLNFACDNASAAPSISGLNTLLLSASSVPVPDVVALAATLNNDGIVNIAGDTGTGVFSVATVNVGTTGQITASADDNGAGLPIVLSICETQPATGECLSPPESSVVTNIDANETPTFGIFVTGAGNVPFDPANNRVFVRFRDDAEETRGSTSVAARTQ